MEEEHTIKTPFDVLLSALQAASSPLSTGRLASICGMGEREVVKWAHMLEKAGKVRIDNRFNGIYIKWTAPIDDEKSLPRLSPTAVYVSESTPFEADLKLARQRERDAKPSLAQESIGKGKRKKVEIASASSVDVGDARLERVNKMIRELKKRKEENIIDIARREAEGSEETVATEVEEKPLFNAEPLEETEAAIAWPAEGEKAELPEELEEQHKPRIRVPSKSVIRPKFRYAAIKQKKIAKIKKPEPVRVTGVSLQFSERLARQMKRIERQARAIDEMRQEKEKLLNDHYLPLQHRLESELETISDRVMRVQSRVSGMQKQASDLPAKVSAVEKVQATSIKAHGEMRRAYDEACALLEESGRQLSEEREKMELMLEQSRVELSRHSAISGDLSNAVSRIEEMEGDAARRVAEARSVLAEQAERLATAESHSNDLRSLRGEIGESIVEMKREVASAKRVLSDLERQMGQMHQIEEYTASIRKDYDEKMSEIDEYIRDGNREFETLRESVEANFVRRYLRELRALTESYSFEFDQARRMEGDIDSRVAEERRKLEQLFEEGKKISYLFETQASAPGHPEKFEQRAEAFSSLESLPSQRSQIAHMIAQVIGGRTESLPKDVHIPVREKKAEEPEPIGITKLIARAKARKRKALAKKAKKRKGKHR